MEGQNMNGGGMNDGTSGQTPVENSPAPKRKSKKGLWITILILIIIVLVAFFVFRDKEPVDLEGMTLGALTELDTKLECALQANVNLPDGSSIENVRHDIKMKGLVMRTEQFLYDSEGNELKQVSVLKDDGFYTSIIDGVEVTNNETGETCDWLRVKHPGGELTEEVRRTITGSLNNVPAEVWQCSESNFSNSEFDTPGVVCDFR